jgi:hypothetical protein
LADHLQPIPLLLMLARALLLNGNKRIEVPVRQGFICAITPVRESTRKSVFSKKTNKNKLNIKRNNTKE